MFFYETNTFYCVTIDFSVEIVSGQRCPLRGTVFNRI